MEYRVSVALAEVSEVPGLEGEHVDPSQPQIELVLGTNASPNFQQLPTADCTTEPASASDSIDIPHPIVEEAPTTDLGNAQDDRECVRGSSLFRRTSQGVLRDLAAIAEGRIQLGSLRFRSYSVYRFSSLDIVV